MTVCRLRNSKVINKRSWNRVNYDFPILTNLRKLKKSYSLVDSEACPREPEVHRITSLARKKGNNARHLEMFNTISPSIGILVSEQSKPFTFTCEFCIYHLTVVSCRPFFTVFTAMYIVWMKHTCLSEVFFVVSSSECMLLIGIVQLKQLLL